MTEKTRQTLVPIGKWLSNNILEMVIIALLAWILNNQDKTNQSVSDLETRVAITEWGILQDPTTPTWIKDAILNPRRGSLTNKTMAK